MQLPARAFSNTCSFDFLSGKLISQFYGTATADTPWFHCPSVKIVLKTKKPNKKLYPKELKIYGGHLRQKRLDLNLKQPEVAKLINVATDTITNWELNENEPTLTYIPRIISLLGYSPIFILNPVKRYRVQKRLNQKELARILKIDQGTLARIEQGNENISEKVKKG